MRAAGVGAAGTGEAAGGEAGHQVLDAPRDAVEAGAEGDDEAGEAWVVEQAAGDDGDEVGDEEADPMPEVEGEVGETGLDRGLGSGVHGNNSHYMGRKGCKEKVGRRRYCWRTIAQKSPRRSTRSRGRRTAMKPAQSARRSGDISGPSCRASAAA